MKKLFFLALVAVSLAGCASDYGAYTKAVAAQQAATESTKAAKLKALGELGCSATYRFDDAGKKVVAQETKCDPEVQKFAAFALAVSGMQTAQEQVAKIEAPYTMREALRDVAGLVVPLANVGAQIYGIQKNAAVAITQSNNSANVAMSTNATMGNIAASGLTAATNIAGAGMATAATLGSKTTNVTTITGNGNATNGSSVTTTTTTSTTNCTTGNGGNGQGGSGSTAAGGAGTAGASGAETCSAGK